MDLSLAEAARLLGKTERQVRYLISKGSLPARKAGQKWRIRRQDLPLSEGQRQASQQKEARSLALELEATSRAKRVSVRDVRAYQIGVPLYHDLRGAAGDDHEAVSLLHEALMLVACGYYEYHGRDKSGYYRRAREQASRAAMTLLLDEKERVEFTERFESQLLPAIGGLIRKSERWGSRR